MTRATLCADADWYQLPAYYDLVFDRLTDGEADFLDALAREHIEGRRDRVLEPACGSGRLLAAMAARGYQVAGFDASAAMVEFARARLVALGVEADLRVARLESFRYRRQFDLAHCLVSSFKYLSSHADAVAALQATARCVRRGGLFVLGLHLTQYEDQRVDRERWQSEKGGTKVVCTIRSQPPDRRTRSEHMRSRLAVHESGRVRRFETRWSFRTYSAGEMRALLRAVPAWRLVSVHDFDYDLNRTQKLGQDRLDTVLVLQRR